MTIAASHPVWSVRPLRASEREEAMLFLDREHELNIYLIARLQELTFDGFGPVIAGFRDDQLVAIATTNANLAIGIDPGLREDEIETVSQLVAREILSRNSYLRAVISPAAIVEPIWRHLEPHFDPPTVVRLRQPVYRLPLRASSAALTHVRHSRIADLDLLVPACAAMHREEIGIDPLVRDAYGYHQRVRDLVEQHRSFVWIEDGGIAFKCEISAETADSAQLMGVWTAPELRRRGYARRGLEEICGHLVRQGRTVTLFVNDFNLPARRLYEHLGFEQIGENQALIW